MDKKCSKKFGGNEKTAADNVSRFNKKTPDSAIPFLESHFFCLTVA